MPTWSKGHLLLGAMFVVAMVQLPQAPVWFGRLGARTPQQVGLGVNLAVQRQQLASARGKCKVARSATPRYQNGDVLGIGEIVGYKLDLPGGFLHAGIHLGPGTRELEQKCGLTLHRDMHYVIEYSGPTRTSGFPQSSPAGRVTSGKGCQNIWITPMQPSTEWYAYKLFFDDDFREAYSGQEAAERALSKLSSSFGGYDAVRNNCQHFAVWAKHGVKSMLLRDEDQKTAAKQLGAVAGGLLLPAPLKLASLCFAGWNILSAKTGWQLGIQIVFS